MLALTMQSMGGIQAQNTNRIFGKLEDITNGEGMIFANVVLVNAADSVQITGTASDVEAKFEFKRVPLGTYFVQVSMIGYHLKNSEIFTISDKTETIDLGTIQIIPATNQLDEVVIEAKRPLISMEPGKTIMNVADNATNQTDNTYDLLKKFPGIAIDNEDNISLNGKSGIMVMVDDRPTYMSGSSLANYLKGIPSNSVERIEAMDNPSSKYDAEGVAGIINIKTIRKTEKGFTGSVFASGGSGRYFKHNEGFDLNYRSSKFTVYGNFSYYHQKMGQDIYMRTEYADGTKHEVNGEDGENWKQKNTYDGLFGKFGADFYVDRKNVVSLSYRGSGGTGNTSTDLMTRVIFNNAILSSYSQDASSEWLNGNHTTNLNYEHLFDTVYLRKISFDLNWLHNNNNGKGDNLIKYYNGDFASFTESIGYCLDQPLVSDVYSVKADFEYQFTPKLKFDAGLKGSYVRNNNKMIYDYTKNELPDTAYNNRYLYDEIIGAAYAMLNYSFSAKTNLQVGLRTEATSFTGENIDMDTLTKGFYCRPFPSINLSQQIGNRHNLNFAYRYRLSRPNYTDLNPFIARNEAYTYSSGNPDLLPEYSHTLDLTYSLGYKYFMTLGYTRSDGTIHNLSYYDDSTHILLTKPENIGKSDYLSISFTTMQSFFNNVWRLRGFINGVYSNSQVFYKDKWEGAKNFNSTIWLSSEVDIIPTLTFEVACWGMLPNKSLFTKTGSYFAVNTGIKKTLLNNMLTLTLSVNDILGMSYKMSGAYPGGTSTVTNVKWDGRQIWLRASYRFGNNKLMNRTPRQLEEAEEASRIGTGGGSGAGTGTNGSGINN
jgi:hypothetical protein